MKKFGAPARPFSFSMAAAQGIDYARRVFVSLSNWLVLWRQRRVLLELTRREISLSTRGTLLGWLWLVLGPLALLAAYTLVFAVIMPASGEGTSWSSTSARIFAALIPFGVFTDALTRSPLLLVAHASYVKKMIFPLELLPAARCLAALFFSLVNLALLLIFEAALGQASLMWLLTPVLYLPLLLLVLGVSWFLSALGVYLRDTAHLCALLATLLLFLTPVFYPLAMVPAHLRFWFWFNPLIGIIEAFRAALVQGIWPDWPSWFISLAYGGLVCVAGFTWFQLTRRGFADVV
jgi:lipopolysaccharide transport system permease protein